MLLSTDFASENDLLDRVMDRGIVIEVWDRVGLAAIDMTGMRVTVSVFQLYSRGHNPPFRVGHFSRVEPL
ncbi:MAG: gas vesicle protein [Acidobacteriia bacterium]|nr:gas vesicle protein [Terriglobia bacterium]